MPLVVVNSGRVGPVSGITGAPGQGEFYLTRYPTQGGNFECITLAPNSAQEAMAMVVEAFYPPSASACPSPCWATSSSPTASRTSPFRKTKTR